MIKNIILLILFPTIVFSFGSLVEKKIDTVIPPSGTITLENNVMIDSGTASTVPFLDAAKHITSSAVTPTELGYLSGVTSPIQGQLSGFVMTTGDEVVAGVKNFSSELLLDHITTPSNPAAGKLKFYTKSDNILYKLDSAGTEEAVGSGSGGGSRLNLIIDNSFEKDVTEGTCTGCTATQETTIVELTDTNTASLKMAFTASTGDYTDTTTTSAEYTGVIGRVSARIKTDEPGVELCSMVNGSEDSCVEVDDNGVWAAYQLDATMSSTSFGYKIKATSSITGNIYVDEIFAGSKEGKDLIVQGVDEEYSVYDYAGHSSTNTFVPYSNTVIVNTISSLGTITDNSTSGITFTALKKCTVVVNFSFANQASDVFMGIVKNGVLNASITATSNDGKRHAIDYTGTGTAPGNATASITLDVGDVIAPLSGSSSGGGTNNYNMNFSLVATPQESDAVLVPEFLKTPGAVKPVVYSARLSNTGTVSREYSNWVNGNCTNATPQVCTWETGAFSATPNCTVTNSDNTNFCATSAGSATSLSIQCFTSAGGNNTLVVAKDIICHGVQ